MVSRQLRAFCEGSIDNYEQVEVLIRLYGNPLPTTTRDLAEALKMEERSATAAIEHLWRLNLVGPVTGGYRYTDGPHAAVVAELDQLYRVNRQAVISLLTELALQRLCAGNIRAFADAFNWRGKK